MLTLEFVREAFDYRDGQLYWKARPLHHFSRERDQKTFNTRYAGRPAGCVNGPDGYSVVHLMDRQEMVHRVVFLWHHGRLPAITDHIDGNRGNNQIENLREANIEQNSWNMRRSTRNTSGCTGVYWNTRRQKWAAEIMVSKTTIRLGCYVNFDDAVAARKAAEDEHYGAFAYARATEG